ncbi:MAG: hypothetical protein K2J97_01080 [Muribaculaceae bacterium]|nr:hypothetical protein [Muribaculaceae bacterium]
MIRIIIFVLLMVVALSALAQYRSSGARWENISTWEGDFSEQTVTTTADDEEPGVKMTMREGYLYVTTDHKVRVRVVSVLGTPVSETVLEAGTSRLPLRSRGIYVVRVGKSVRRVKVN